MSTNSEDNFNNSSELLYDQRETNVPVHWSVAAALGVLSDLSDRGGVGDALADIDHDTKQEIVIELAEIIATAHKNSAR